MRAKKCTNGLWEWDHSKKADPNRYVSSNDLICIDSEGDSETRFRNSIKMTLHDLLT